jgi:hypothetical protein
MHRLFLLAACLAAAWLLPGVAHAADGFDNCAGFIDTLPKTVKTPGTWCLRKDLAMATGQGQAITIASDGVTLDCNGFGIDGSAGGISTKAMGIYAIDRRDLAVRDCRVSGFYMGILLEGNGRDNLVEDSLVEHSRYKGAYMSGLNNRFLRNRVLDTGGSPGNVAVAIEVAGEIVDNVVDGVRTVLHDLFVIGISAGGTDGGIVRGNRVRGLDPLDGSATAIQVFCSIVIDNDIEAMQPTAGVGIYGAKVSRGNKVRNFETAYRPCGGASSLGDLESP